MNKIEIAPGFKGTLVPLDLLNSICTIPLLPIKREVLEKGGIFFEVIGDDFIFRFGSSEKSVFVERNDTSLIFPFEDIPVSEHLIIILTWSHTQLRLWCNPFLASLDETELKAVEVKTKPCSPPFSLIKWAREQNLIKINTFETEEQFREKMYSCLESIQQKIDEFGTHDQFWSIQRSGNEIIEKKPKHETENHETIISLLHDPMFISGIEMVPEYKTGVGNLDIMFIGTIENKGMSKFCAEFKNAHATDLHHGLEKQLPNYMRNKGSKYGAYCVFNFDLKQRLSRHELNMKFIETMLNSKDPLLIDGVRVFIYDVYKKKTASKK